MLCVDALGIASGAAVMGLAPRLLSWRGYLYVSLPGVIGLVAVAVDLLLPFPPAGGAGFVATPGVEPAMVGMLIGLCAAFMLRPRRRGVTPFA